MSSDDLVSLLSQALALITYLSLLPIVTATVVGIIVSIFQALTQIQEQNLAFTFKLIAIIVVLWMSGPYMSKQLYDYTIEVFEKIY